MCKRIEITGNTTIPQIGEADRPTQRITTYQSRTLHGNQCQEKENPNCNGLIGAGSGWTSQKVKNSRGGWEDPVEARP